MNSKNQILTFLLVLFLSVGSHAQKSVFFCASDKIHQSKTLEDSVYRNAVKHAEKLIYERTLEFYKKKSDPYLRSTTAPVLTIPVVVHVMHLDGEAEGTGSNISTSQIQAGIDHLNQAYSNTASYAGGPNHTNAGVPSADIEIQFCLATRNPDGCSTTGINRMATSYSNLYSNEPCNGATQDRCLKALSFWDSRDYMNIWLVNEIYSGTISNNNPGVAGYAYLAGAHGTTFDGVVNEAEFWGTSTDDSKVHIHEVGHYLNLYHTFNDPDEEYDINGNLINGPKTPCTNDNCLQDGDFVCDTPPDNSSAAYDCNSDERANTCSTDADDMSSNNPFSSDVQDMYENYMDYGYQSCQNTFTPGQKVRMRTALTEIRTSLLNSQGCVTPAVPESNFIATTSTTICAGETVSFADNSTNGLITGWSWTFEGGSPATSTDQNPTVTWNTAGTYIVSMTATNCVGQGNTKIKTAYVTVNQSSTLTYCNMSTTNMGVGYDLGVDRVQFNTIDYANTSTDQNTQDFICSQFTEVTSGSTYQLNVNCGSNNGNNSPKCKVYIDYDGDGTYDEDELVYNGSTNNTTHTSDITIPTTGVAHNKLVGMRVYTSLNTRTGACTASDYGEAEDYGVIVTKLNSTDNLPVELNTFYGTAQENHVDLTWETLSEINNDFFTLNHSIDGQNFTIVERIKAEGDAHQISKYNHIHKDPNDGINYYRLEQTDLDGTTVKLKTITVIYDKKKEEYLIVPNPIQSDILALNYSGNTSQKVNIQLVDIRGAIIYNRTIILKEKSGRIELSTDGVQSGLYFIRLKKNREVKYLQFVKI